MIHEILPVGVLQCNCSIFGDEQSREAMVVDPGDEIGSVLEMVAHHGLTVKAIVITHAHIDHIGGAQKLKQATGAPVYMNLQDTELQKMMPVQAGWLGVPTPEAVAMAIRVTLSMRLSRRFCCRGMSAAGHGLPTRGKFNVRIWRLSRRDCDPGKCWGDIQFE